MNIFMTNATGYVGSAVADALRQRGHHVSALARREASISRLTELHVQPIPGELAQPESFLATAMLADVVVHTAFEYFPDGRENHALDSATTAALLAAMGRQKRQRLIYTSNAYLPQVEHEMLVDTSRLLAPDEQARAWRLQVERQVVEANGPTLSTAILRLGMVYGGHGGGTIADLLQTASDLQELRYPERQAGHRWSLISRSDLAALYACLCEQWEPGVFHGVDAKPLTIAEVCQIVASHEHVKAVAVADDSPDLQLSTHARQIMARDRALNCPRSKALGWQPQHVSLATGIDSCERSNR